MGSKQANDNIDTKTEGMIGRGRGAKEEAEEHVEENTVEEAKEEVKLRNVRSIRGGWQRYVETISQTSCN